MVRVLGCSHRRAEGRLSPVPLALPQVEEIPVAQTAALPTLLQTPVLRRLLWPFCSCGHSASGFPTAVGIPGLPKPEVLSSAKMREDVGLWEHRRVLEKDRGWCAFVPRRSTSAGADVLKTRSVGTPFTLEAFSVLAAHILRQVVPSPF